MEQDRDADKLILRDEKGGCLQKFIIFGLIFAFIIYQGYLIVVPWYNYYSFKGKVEDRLRLEAHITKDKIEKILYELVDEHDIPLSKKDVKIVVTDSKISVHVEWDVTVPLLFGEYPKTFHYEVDIKRG
ncbi:MAG: hypothetical protein AB1488_07605 [Nitrospirota bacterium]